METVNQILVTLKEADRYARSQNPHHHRLAVVLLDNILELQIRRKSEKTFAWDRTTWYSGVRQYDRKRRHKVSRDHGELLALAVAESIITDEELKLLAFAHRIRNRTYHDGESEDKVDLRIGLVLLYRFVRRRFPEWKNGRFGMALTPRRPIPVEDVSNDDSGWSPLLFGFEEDGRYDFLSEEHWAKVLERCLTFDDAIDVRPLIKRRIDNLLEDVQGWLDQITEDEKMDFGFVLAARFSVLTGVFSCEKVIRSGIGAIGAMNVYLAVLDDEERLLDIEDPAERDAEFRKLIGEHKFQKDVISSLDLDKFRAIAETVTERTEAEGITHFLEIEEQLKKIARAAKECASDLDDHIQLLIDERRGK